MVKIFLTGTDTGVGKTHVACRLLRAWRGAGRSAVGFKPVAAGDRDDAVKLRAAGGNVLPLDSINPLFLRAPAAPLAAAEAEGLTPDFPALARGVRAAAENFTHVVVEGVGGWRVPLAPGYEVREWARDFGWPVVVVARAGLGTLNHTLLTVESIQAAGLTCAGVVLNPGADASPDLDLPRRTNATVLARILGLPVLELERLVHAPVEIPQWLGGE